MNRHQEGKPRGEGGRGRRQRRTHGGDGDHEPRRSQQELGNVLKLGGLGAIVSTGPKTKGEITDFIMEGVIPWEILAASSGEAAYCSRQLEHLYVCVAAAAAVVRAGEGGSVCWREEDLPPPGHRTVPV